ncbi:MAG: molybdopterin converting factor subunit 1 [Kurthia gibsonii]|uniref:molybdopterin converting factor subunit 1 n=1 Tax=Kurthia TaxID=1649 RepID=UPI000EB4FDEE|nr:MULTISPECIES: molybdopterin converting factor subunit 1 [Kurthia]RXH51592.1 molybdopterin converting factor subunit 1 [Kurthia gibsonii]WIL38462.1 molybdopterin converting factor subunit 1 [Kurthia sp. YJT4]HZG10993.1 molybdopterin converting factor subunit 1 [Kurthia gibsonii]
MISILFFAQLQESMGQSQMEVPLEGKTVAEVKTWLEKEYPLLSLGQVMTAVNEEFARDQTIVNEGDQVAFIPPISGG